MALKTGAVGAVAAIGTHSETWRAAFPMHEWACRWCARGTGVLAELLGYPTYVDGLNVYGVGYAVRVIPACNALTETAMVLTGAVLLAARLRTRLVWGLVGAGAVVVINLLRIVAVLATGTHSPDMAHLLHEGVYPFVWAGVFACLWLCLLRREFAESDTREKAEVHAEAGSPSIRASS